MMTEYCSVAFSSWEPDNDPNIIVEYVFDSEDAVPVDHERPHMKDHFSALTSPRLQVTQNHDHSSEDNHQCQVTLQCKAIYSVAIKALSVASEARTVELYDTRDGCYLQTVRGRKDKEDSEADGSRIHFMCQCTLDEPLGALTIKFLSLGQRESFEIAHIKLILETSSTQGTCNPTQSRHTIDMEKLRQDVDSMGDTVSDRAKSFLATLETFQKSKQGAVNDMRHLLLDKNQAGAEGRSVAGITTLLSMFASSPAMGSSSPIFAAKGQSPDAAQSEGSVMNNMLSQMMSSFTAGSGSGLEKGAGPADNRGDVHNFLQSLCGQVSQMRVADARASGDDNDQELGKGEQAMRGSQESEMEFTPAELESHLTAQVEAMVETRLTAVEEHIKQQVNQRMDELETRMTGKLDAIFALLQNTQKQS